MGMHGCVSSLPNVLALIDFARGIPRRLKPMIIEERTWHD